MSREQFYRGLHLERQDPARNLHSADGLQLARSLFGRWDAQRAGGRVGRLGRTRTEWFETAGKAEQVLLQECREKPRCGHVLSPQPGQGR